MKRKQNKEEAVRLRAYGFFCAGAAKTAKAFDGGKSWDGVSLSKGRMWME